MDVGIKDTLVVMPVPTTALQHLLAARHTEAVTQPSHTDICDSQVPQTLQSAPRTRPLALKARWLSRILCPLGRSLARSALRFLESM